MSSVIYFNLDQSKILLSGNGLNQYKTCDTRTHDGHRTMRSVNWPSGQSTIRAHEGDSMHLQKPSTCVNLGKMTSFL